LIDDEERGMEGWINERRMDGRMKDGWMVGQLGE
jgi:hypothetical protein